MIIEEVRLYTAHMKEMRHFYENVLGLPAVTITSDSFSLQIGWTRMVFVESPAAYEPFYHFAWMIPSNLFREAKAWISERTTLNVHEGRDETYSVNWNSHSLYFEDPSGNILELIAHHTVLNESDHAFGAGDLVSVCEIGLVSEDVSQSVLELGRQGLEPWRDWSDTFAPIGDVNGLFIVVKKERIWFFSDKPAQIFPMTVTIRGVGAMHLGSWQQLKEQRTIEK